MSESKVKTRRMSRNFSSKGFNYWLLLTGAVLGVGVVFLLLWFMNGNAYLSKVFPLSSPQITTGTEWGGHPSRGEYKDVPCHYVSSSGKGKFKCEDKDGSPLLYHCGMEFEAFGFDEDTHANLICDVEVHMDAALGLAEGAATGACPANCLPFVKTGSWVGSWCYISGEPGDEFSKTGAMGHVFGTCPEKPNPSPEDTDA